MYYVKQLHNVPHYEVPTLLLNKFLMVIEKVKKKKLNGERLAGVSEVKPEVYPGVFMDNFCKVVNNCGTVVPDEIVERVISLYLCGNTKK